MTDFWDTQAPTFDDEPDHGLRDPSVRACWRNLLLSALPPAPARIADLGCGTGSITVLLAAEGYDLHGVDSSTAMLAAARTKAAAAGVTTHLSQAHGRWHLRHPVPGHGGHPPGRRDRPPVDRPRSVGRSRHRRALLSRR